MLAARARLREQEARTVAIRADLRPNLESIKYFRPIDEPDVEVRQPGKGVTW